MESLNAGEPMTEQNTLVNITKSRLQAGKIAWGLGIRASTSIDIVFAARASGYHYLFIDLEHSTLDVGTAGQLCLASVAAGITPVVRVAAEDKALTARMLDGGAHGIVAPHINTRADAEEVVRNCMFPPLGQRSNGSARAQAGYQPLPSSSATATLNDLLLLVAMIETPEAVENADEIASVEGIDVLSVGTNDLATEMGIPGQFAHPLIFDAYEKVITAARRHGKQIRLGGIFDEKLMQNAIELGARMMTVGNDTAMLFDAMTARKAAISKLAPPQLL